MQATTNLRKNESSIRYYAVAIKTEVLLMQLFYDNEQY